MRVARVVVKNFRSLKDIDICVDDYTALIGPNGAGKSSVLYALDWFFKGGGLTVDDVHRSSGLGAAERAQDDDDRFISVAVTFNCLSPVDKERLGKYGMGSEAVFRRTWMASNSREKIIGNALQGPGFSAVRDSKKVGEFRPAYAKLRESFNELPDLGPTPSKESCETALRVWEIDDSNFGKLEEVSDSDASHLFGVNGTSVISQCSRAILVPASLDMAGEVGAFGKKTALNELVGALMSAAGEKIHAAWRIKYVQELAELHESVRIGIDKSTAGRATAVNARLQQLIPGTEVRFTPTIPEWVPKSDATIRTDVIVNGVANDVARQGHGTQRAVMMSMLQALVPDVSDASASHMVLDEESEVDAQNRLKEELAGLPSLLVCIEEPEIYQHPVRARAFARVLTELSNDPNVQVIVATHSPYFVRPEQFSSLRRISLDGATTNVSQATVQSIADEVDKDVETVLATVMKQVPTGFSEGFFSDRVVLVEGDTDKAILEVLCDRLGFPLDAAGVSIVHVGGKGNLKMSYAILNSLGVPTYVVVDGDARNSLRSAKHIPGSEGQLEARKSHKLQTEDAISWMKGATELGLKFECVSTSTDFFTIWHDDIETELENWSDFVDQISKAGGQLRTKKMAHYRAAAIGVELDGMPESIRDFVKSIRSFGE
ncbi:ATP-dependent nuclease [Rhodococcus qingshengii]|uniref:ATP-dependent nuclease n=1 Tax=Rhodococcus qingshengii TaxID=334542 RepID=UPI0022B4C500|nr:AAA family ATPase [Rhodococcus qingshengii]MCZ4614512.1 AAA family ATPase [Rhodococcus qingshengii]